MKRKYLFVGVIAFLAVAFAAVTTTLVMRGGVILAENTEDYAIYFSKSVINDKDESKRTISTDGQALTFDAKMNTLGDVTKLDYEVTNASKNYDAKVSVECELEDQTEGGSPVNIDRYLSIEYSNLESIIPARETGTGSIIVTMKRSMVNDVKLGLKCNLKFDADERDSLGSTPSGSGASNYSFKGYLVDKYDAILTNTSIVILDNERKVINTGNDEETPFIIEGLDMGFHEVYIIEGKTIEEINNMSDDEIKANATTSAKFTQSSKEIIFDNGYKIANELVKKEYVITFDAQGGLVNPKTKKVFTRDVYGELPTPTLTGYIFNGWYTSTEYTDEVTQNQKVMIDDNITLYAKWEAKTITINFNSNGGKDIASKTAKYNTTFGDLETPVRSGYSFLGWYLNNTRVSSSTRVTSTSDITLVAKWDAKKETITVDNAGESIDVEVDLTKPLIESLPKPTKPGYTFDGWYNEDEKISNDKILGEDEKVNIKAKYTANKYTITYDANEGIVSTSTKEVTFDSPYGELPIPSRDGYNFIGWFTAKANGSQITDDTIVKITSKQIVYAHWSAKTDITYKVKHWKQNVGSNAESKDTTNYTLEETEALKGTTNASVSPNTKTYEGFTAPTKETITVKADGSAEVNYYYTRKSYTLTINKDAGVESVNTKISYQYEEEVNLSYTIKKGYTFSSITGDKTTSTFLMPASNVTVSISTTINTYTITYNLDGGTVSGNPTSYNVNSSDIILKNPTKTGYTFTGWTEENETDKNINVTIATGSTGDKVYTAIFNPNTYTITFDSNGGNNIATVLTVTYDKTYGDTLPTPTKEGYSFDGWFTEKTGGTQVTSTTRVDISENATLYAHWSLATHEVLFKIEGKGTLKSNTFTIGENETSSTDIILGESIKNIKAESEQGYYFTSLRCTNDYIVEVDDNEISSEKLTSFIAKKYSKINSNSIYNLSVFNNNINNNSVCTAKFSAIDLAYDATSDNNLRYIGESPNNYIEFNGEKWRIVGLMNNVKDSQGSALSRIKIIHDPLYGFAYDTSNLNNWNTASSQKILNSGDYFNRTNSFSDIGLTENSKKMITKAIWNLGGHSKVSGAASTYYIYERGTKVPTGRPATWLGYVGLMYPSDYGYAVGGNVRQTCLGINMTLYDTNNCFANDWLFVPDRAQWTLTPLTSDLNRILIVSSSKKLSDDPTQAQHVVRPTVYLDINVQVTGGTGEINDPYTIVLP